MTIYKIEKTTYLDKFNKCYKNIITINKNPNNELNKFLKTMPREKLSIFDYNNCCDNIPHCLHAFYDFKNNDFISHDNIDQVFSLLIESGFNIEFKMTKLVKDKNLICFVSKN